MAISVPFTTSNGSDGARVTIMATRKQGTGCFASGVFALAKREYAKMVSNVCKAQIALSKLSLNVQDELKTPKWTYATHQAQK